MGDIICEQCGAACSDDASHCPKCGTPVFLSAEEEDNPAVQLTRTLLFQARTYQQRGDLANAIKCATDALAIRPTCSTIHTFLGSLYEQKGEMAAARLHFQKALTVTLTPDDDGCDLSMLPLPEVAATQPTSSGWMLPVLVGCIVFSGLAAMFTLWPGNIGVERGGIVSHFIPRKSQPPLPVPGPHPEVKTPDGTPVSDDDHERTKTPKRPDTIPLPIPEDDDSNGARLTNPGDGQSPRVIGSSATGTLPVLTATPTAEQAEEAYSHGEYERAATIYEQVLPTQEKPSPRVHHHLALCYQRLGNMKKVEHHLGQAIDGYQKSLAEDSQNAVLQQELRDCQAMLDSLHNAGGGAGTR